MARNAKLMIKKHVPLVFEAFSERNPDPRGELVHENPFELLIAVILSAQATDISVNKATEVLYKVANTPEAILALGEKKLKSYIKTIGLYNNKAKNILLTCQMLIDHHDGQVPSSLEALIKLPGVGRKTANVVLQMAFDQDTIAVDTHVYRVSRRLGFSKQDTADKVELDLMKVVPKPYLRGAHHWLILHGRYICKARKPVCSECFLTQYCVYYRNNSQVDP